MAELTKEQQIQEDEYEYPYHWCKKPGNSSSRLYFGYLSLAAAMSRKISSLKDSDRKLKIIDVGCGDARFLKELQNTEKFDLHGVDYSEKAISFAKLLLPDVTFFVADLGSESDFPNDTYDIVFMIETLEHIVPDNIPAMLTEIKRILKPGGEFIVTVPSDALPPGPKHYQHFSAKKLEDTLKDHFEVIEIVGQDKMGFHPLKLVYFFLDNKYWTIKPLAQKYNLNVWHKFFNKCANNEGRRVISLAIKKD
ncbi:MAG: class I SAM-dependent methyltransferase [Melioribacteraceae bacterium]|nr:class I SAM-dependent methyltransferase [Melioribacteraceae bacterium]